MMKLITSRIALGGFSLFLCLIRPSHGQDSPIEGSGISILYLKTDTEGDNPGFRQALSGITGGTVDYANAPESTPPSLLLRYECVMVHYRTTFEDPVTMGNRLADYVDQGGTVVFSDGGFLGGCSTLGVQGRFVDQNYSPITAPQGCEERSEPDVYQGDGRTLLYDGIENFRSVIDNRDVNVVLQGDGRQDGTYSSGIIAAAYRPDFSVVYLNGSYCWGTEFPGRYCLGDNHPRRWANACSVARVHSATTVSPRPNEDMGSTTAPPVERPDAVSPPTASLNKTTLASPQSFCFLCGADRDSQPSNYNDIVTLDFEGFSVNFTCGHLSFASDLSVIAAAQSQSCPQLQAQLGEVCDCPADSSPPPTQPPGVSEPCTLCADVGSLYTGYRPDGTVTTPTGDLTCEQLNEFEDLSDFVAGQGQTCAEFQAQIVDICACPRLCGPLCADGSRPSNPDAQIGTVVGDYSCQQLFVLGDRISDSTFGISCEGFSALGTDLCGCPAASMVPTSLPSSSLAELPSNLPTRNPTSHPSAQPSLNPTAPPTASPTSSPTVLPSSSPTMTPSSTPSASPSTTPSDSPTMSPSSTPSASPSTTPTLPLNDICENARELSTDGSVVVGSTESIEFTNSQTPPQCPALQGLWYSFQGTGALVDVSTCHPETNYSTALAIYTGDCDDIVLRLWVGSSPLHGTCKENKSFVAFVAKEMERYYILVHGDMQNTDSPSDVLGATSTVGTFGLSITETSGTDEALSPSPVKQETSVEPAPPQSCAVRQGVYVSWISCFYLLNALIRY